VIEPIKIEGLKLALRELDKLQPGVRKQFMKDARMILAPAVTEIRNAYPAKLLGGAERNWSGNNRPKRPNPNKFAADRKVFPYSQAAARRGVTVATSASGRKPVIRIVQKDPAAIVAEFAGAGRPNRLAQSLSFKYGRPGRFVWPAIERKKDEVQANMKKATMQILARANRNLR